MPSVVLTLLPAACICERRRPWDEARFDGYRHATYHSKTHNIHPTICNWQYIYALLNIQPFSPHLEHCRQKEKQQILPQTNHLIV